MPTPWVSFGPVYQGIVSWVRQVQQGEASWPRIIHRYMSYTPSVVPAMVR